MSIEVVSGDTCSSRYLRALQPQTCFYKETAAHRSIAVATPRGCLLCPQQGPSASTMSREGREKLREKSLEPCERHRGFLFIPPDRREGLPPCVDLSVPRAYNLFVRF